MFGGEPLIDADAVATASTRVRDACARAGCGYEATVITNATLLDGFGARRLSRAGVTALQVTIPVARRGAHAALDQQRFARVLRSVREAREVLEVLVRFEVNGTDDLREALSTVRVLEREGLLSPPHPAVVLIGPRASYAAQARALFVARPARTPPAITRCP
jgi:sulfatase maturation enzyme AslB (radical SAM superfamily)